jgi:transcriptional regulator with XRE-family HTH domain
MSDERGATAVDIGIGQILRRRRIEIGMSQERLAEVLGITFQQIQKYEKGVNRIAASRLWDISKALDLPVTRFFDAAPKAPVRTSKIERETLASPESVQLMSLFGTITSRSVRRRVVDLVRTMAEDET